MKALKELNDRELAAVNGGNSSLMLGGEESFTQFPPGGQTKKRAPRRPPWSSFQGKDTYLGG